MSQNTKTVNITTSEKLSFEVSKCHKTIRKDGPYNTQLKFCTKSGHWNTLYVKYIIYFEDNHTICDFFPFLTKTKTTPFHSRDMSL